MFWKRKKPDRDDLVTVPLELPPVEGLDDHDEYAPGRRPRTWLWTLIAALAVVLLFAYVLFLGAFGVYDGLKDRALENRQIAEEHYNLGLSYLEAKDYELAIAEFELALRHNSNLPDAQAYLQEAKELARAQAMPTSETRQDAARALYGQAVIHYENGTLREAIQVLDELRGLDADYQRENVETMLVTAHYQLGLNAVVEDRLDEAIEHFEAVLILKPDHKDAQEQLNLADLYRAALSHWDQDWGATIQALKGLYALAPSYKDVQSRLHQAYTSHAEAFADGGDWCRASQEYAAAVDVLPLETTVDRRDDAAIRCQATAEAPTPSPTVRATARPTAGPTPSGQTTPTPEAEGPTPTAPSSRSGWGRIAFASFDAVRQRYDIYVINLSQGDAKLLREDASQPAFTPSGQRLAFRNHDPLHLGLGILDLRSDGVSELTAHGEDSAPTWSPDTSQVVFASDKHGGDRRWRLYAISPNEVRGEGEEWAFGRMPVWSPDGSQIAYHGCDERGDNCGVWIMKAGGFEPVRLTTNPSDTAPAWSPDGSQVAFISARSGNWELYAIEIATGQETQLTNHPATDVSPVWSPDGQRLAFLSNREGSWALYILNTRSAQIERIIAVGDGYPDPVNVRLSWAP
jgi:tetratricopeptide (TPR) repeat protein